MRGFVANTDFDWFTFLAARQPLEEVNFWQPSAHGFNAPAGTPFFFRLKAPHNAIAGFGVFARYEAATPKLAWEAFGEKNGAASYAAMMSRIEQYAHATGPAHRIGCIMVATPVFFEARDWIKQPRDWKRNVVILIHKGKQQSRNVFLDGGLRSALQQLLDLLFPQWHNQAKPEYPFRHLENDGVWTLVPIEGASETLRAAKEARAEAWDILRHVRCAQLDEAVFERLASSFEDRFRVLRLLTRAYFPPDRSGRLWDFLGDDLPGVPVPRAADGEQVSERALEEHLEQHWAETPFARAGVELARREAHGWPCRQVFTPVNSIDLLGFDGKARCWWVFELKRGRSADRVVGQVSRYLGWIGADRRGTTRQSRIGRWRHHRPQSRSEASVRGEGQRAALALGVRRAAPGQTCRVIVVSTAPPSA